jgi:hypothetical protein
MDSIIKASYLKEGCMVKVSMPNSMVQSIKETGNMINNKEKVRRIGSMVHPIQENMWKD